MKTIVLEDYAKHRARRIGAFKKYGITILFLLPFIAAFITFFVVPLFYGIYISLTNFKYDQPGIETFNSFEWYKILFTGNSVQFPERLATKLHDSFWLAFLHTLIFSIIMVPIAILLPLFLAILINRKPPAYKLFRSLIYLPSIVPLTAAGTIFTMLFLSPNQHGILYELFGIDIAWFNDLWFTFDFLGKTIDVPYAWIPIFLMCLWGGWGGNFIILNAGLQNVPRHLYEACEIDGCSEWKKIMNVTIPGIKPQLVLCLFTTIIGYLGLYGQVTVLTGPVWSSTYDSPMQLLQFLMSSPGKGAMTGYITAVAIIFGLITMIFTAIEKICTRDKKKGDKHAKRYYNYYAQEKSA